MKILKLLSRKYLSIFIILILSFSFSSIAEEEPVDIWDLDNNEEENSLKEGSENNGAGIIITDEEGSYKKV